MALNPGTRLGSYEILAPLGAGGMGEVYRARDSRLGRQVALKVLPEAFARDTDRMARFEREAHLLASLNHPNIAAIHGLEEADDVRCMVLELVEGETLAQRRTLGPVLLEEALVICRQIADALEAAHEHGIIHRDLKPSNVKVTPEGTLKVLDFGLAKALEGESQAVDVSKSPTLSRAATQAGVLLGTPAYMSPEQARGRPADKRADVWAFGCVLYGLLASRQAFEGETVSDTLAAVIKTEPDWNAVPATTPVALQRLLRRCLEKDPRRRLRDIGEARIVIEDVLAGRAEEPPAITPPLLRPALSRRQQLLFLAGLVLVAAAAAAISWTLKPVAPEPPLRKFELAAPSLELNLHNPLAMSPDGTKVVYASEGQLWLRELGQLEVRRLPAAEGVHSPFFSPDSAFVGYFAGRKLWKVPVSGGGTASVAELPDTVEGGVGATWGQDGRIIFAIGRNHLFQVSAQGGDLQPFLQIDPKTETDLHQPQLLPDGHSVLFAVHRKDKTYDTLAVVSRQTRKDLLQLEEQQIWNPVYSPTGHILYRRQPGNAGIWALPFSLAKLEVTGEPFLIAPEGDYPSVSREGTFLYVRNPGAGLTQLVWLNRTGQVERTIGQPQRQVPFPALSPDERRVAVEAEENQNSDVWIHDVERGTKTRLTFASAPEFVPAWSPAGDRIFFTSGTSPGDFTIWVKAADGTGEPQMLVKGVLPTVSRDGKYLLYTGFDEKENNGLWYLPLEGKQQPVVFLESPASETAPRLSSDGRYVAYMSNESGRWEVYLKRFPSGQGKWQVSVNGGHWPHWSRKGDKLFYVQGDDIMEVYVSTRPVLTLSNPRKLFTRRDSGFPVPFDWPDEFDVSADGQHFLLVQPVEQKGVSAGITVVQNWFAEFREKR